MKKTIFIATILFVFLIGSVSAEDLSDYPNLFIRGSSLDVITVVGDKAPATHVIAQTQIALALTGKINKRVPGLTRLSSEIDRFENINLISIGNACDNPISAEILGNPGPCSAGLERGKAAIELYEAESGKYHMVLNAYGDEGVRALGLVLANIDDIDMTGMRYQISVLNEKERTFPEQATVVEKPKPILIDDQTSTDEEPADNEAVTSKSKSQSEGNKQPEEGANKDTEQQLEDSEIESVLKKEDNLVMRFFTWLKSLFS